MPGLTKRSTAFADLRLHAIYLTESAGAPVALRFLEAAEQAFAMLAKNPHLGPAIRFGQSELEGLRYWQIREFKRYLIFYKPSEDGVEILRVLHGMRDLERVLSQDPR
jgi:toxin ParE1/3/4